MSITHIPFYPSDWLAGPRDSRRRLSESEKRNLLVDQRGKCFYCAETLHHIETHDDDFNSDPLWACTDHKIPWVHGGRTNMDNCVIACRSCNSKKGIKSASEFLI